MTNFLTTYRIILATIVVMVVFGPLNALVFSQDPDQTCFTDPLTGQFRCQTSVSVSAQEANTDGPLYGLTTAAGKEFKGFGESVPEIISSIILSVLGMVGVIFLILIIYGGIIWMTAGGNEQRIDRAKKILTGATIGLIIIVLGYAITYFVVEAIVGAQTPPAPGSGTP